MGKEPSEEFQIAVKRIRRRKHSRMPKGYRKDPRDYRVMPLIKEPTCEECDSWRKTGVIVICGIPRKEPKNRMCAQDGVCKDWTPFPQETEGST